MSGHDETADRKRGQSPDPAMGARVARGNGRRFARIVTLTPALSVVFVMLIAPTLLMLLYSFLRFVSGRITDFSLTLDNYTRLLGDTFYLNVIWETLELGFIVTAITLFLGYPLAFFLARTRSRFKPLFTYLVFMPLMIGIVVRAYGWIVILGHDGGLNNFLVGVGILERPFRFLYTAHAVVIGLVEVLLPFMVMPLLSSIEKIDPHVEEAARALSATRTQTFFRITLPLSLPGVVSGSLMVFSLTITAYALPALLGGPKVKMISALAYDAMLVGYNWPFGSAIGIVMIVVSTAIVYAYLKSLGRRQG
ncbi:MAG: ABC transporter permease [Alphaproteobacteria bacterium]|nr:ABC transporter permease [Alphaproteobacteria bacterium]